MLSAVSMSYNPTHLLQQEVIETLRLQTPDMES